ncbi:DoxX family protein [Kitasatospora sp. NPDC059648]|uniref:DoxX family protein n=1 Tax=Kitasatospora sp. NPDC059648 TaxID=3346894 RepID=UPI00368FF560
MNTFIWIVQGVLAVVFAATAIMKLAMPREKLITVFAWVEQFPDATVKAIGALELLVGLGLILPSAVNIAPGLVPWAAVGGLALALGGTAVHLRRSEAPIAAVNIVFIAGLVLIAWGRFGPHHF